MKRLLCLALGHDWFVTRMNLRKHGNLAHLHTVAGCDAVCTRCWTPWYDFGAEPELDHLVRFGDAFYTDMSELADGRGITIHPAAFELVRPDAFEEPQ